MTEQNSEQLNYAQKLIAVLQKNCNELFAKTVQLEAQIIVKTEENTTLEKELESYKEENNTLKQNSGFVEATTTSKKKGKG